MTNKKEYFETPILFLIFNRPELSEIVFREIRQIKPKRLFISADGPRKSQPKDLLLCRTTRERILGLIDWDCEVKTLFRSENLGCGMAVSSAVNWFFDQVEEGIIIEDDILAGPDFFFFCEEMLERYRENKSVMHISGFNPVANLNLLNRQNVIVSNFGNIWGWASWRRAWSKFDLTLMEWGNPEKKKKVLSYFPSKYRKKRRQLYDSIFKGNTSTWDYQWTFARLLANGTSIISPISLIMNIGFNEHSTHTHVRPNWAKNERGKISGVKIEVNPKIDTTFDLLHLKIMDEGNSSRHFVNIVSKIRKCIFPT
jgi:GR25 family glycosyltransferase involved in LPS biosynthesis